MILESAILFSSDMKNKRPGLLSHGRQLMLVLPSLVSAL
jgi:hypothetical protein